MQRLIVAKELAKFFGLLAHPLRIRIVEELGTRELTVGELKEKLDTPQALISQHLAILRNGKLVLERREGRHVYYHVRKPELAKIILDCTAFVEPDIETSEDIIKAIKSAKAAWQKKDKKKNG